MAGGRGCFCGRYACSRSVVGEERIGGGGINYGRYIYSRAGDEGRNGVLMRRHIVEVALPIVEGRREEVLFFCLPFSFDR